jgi:lysophospholipase L1-like esterase
MKKILFFILSLALLSACKQKINEFNADKGSADFTRYVAIGNSLTAGYADGALYKSGQLYSIPNLIAGQLQTVGNKSFVQPIVPSEYGVGYPGATPKFILGYVTDCTNTISLSPELDFSGAMAPLQPVGYPVDNFGIPGAKSFHLLAPGYGNMAGLLTGTANPYYVRFASSISSTTLTVLQDILARNPSFFTMWLGDNDALAYALAGGVKESLTPAPVFQSVMDTILHYVTLNGSKGVIATIPNVTTIPFFTTVPYNGLYLSRQSLCDSINGGMMAYQLPYRYHVGYNPFLMEDSTVANPMFKVRQMRPGELVLMTVPQDSMKCGGMGIISSHRHIPFGIPNQFVLDSIEIAAIQAAIVQYNTIIRNLATKYNLGLADMNARMLDLQKGVKWDGISLNATFVTGGAFSLDGIHMNPRGCALAANYFIEAINAKYGSTVPLVDITKYHGIIFP